MRLLGIEQASAQDDDKSVDCLDILLHALMAVFLSI